jgi:hypothetical protein
MGTTSGQWNGDSAAGGLKIKHETPSLEEKSTRKKVGKGEEWRLPVRIFRSIGAMMWKQDGQSRLRKKVEGTSKLE